MLPLSGDWISPIDGTKLDLFGQEILTRPGHE
jgi:hypothetical protein